MNAPRAIVVSLRKSGTHLVKEVITALGYSVTGQIARTAGGSPETHYLGKDAVRRVLDMVYLEDELAELFKATDRSAVEAAVRRAQEALMNSWRIRLGLSEAPEAAGDDLLTQLIARTLGRGASRRFRDTPEGLCWFLHQLDIDRVDGGFLREWMEAGEPKIIFNYRDPRDVLVSMVNFLTTRSDAELAGLPDHQLYGQILKAIPTTGQRLTFALLDPCFPGSDAFGKALWLLRHPLVCAVSFEELVGPEGGGTDQGQLAAVTKIVNFLDGDQDPAVIARRLFNPDSFTFHRGRIGAWREHFTAEHEELFSNRYGQLVDAYGYR